MSHFACDLLLRFYLSLCINEVNKYFLPLKQTPLFWYNNSLKIKKNALTPYMQLDWIKIIKGKKFTITLSEKYKTEDILLFVFKICFSYICDISEISLRFPWTFSENFLNISDISQYLISHISHVYFRYIFDKQI